MFEQHYIEDMKHCVRLLQSQKDHFNMPYLSEGNKTPKLGATCNYNVSFIKPHRSSSLLKYKPQKDTRH